MLASLQCASTQPCINLPSSSARSVFFCQMLHDFTQSGARDWRNFCTARKTACWQSLERYPVRLQFRRSNALPCGAVQKRGVRSVSAFPWLLSARFDLLLSKSPVWSGLRHLPVEQFPVRRRNYLSNGHSHLILAFVENIECASSRRSGKSRFESWLEHRSFRACDSLGGRLPARSLRRRPHFPFMRKATRKTLWLWRATSRP